MRGIERGWNLDMIHLVSGLEGARRGPHRSRLISALDRAGDRGLSMPEAIAAGQYSSEDSARTALRKLELLREVERIVIACSGCSRKHSRWRLR